MMEKPWEVPRFVEEEGRYEFFLTGKTVTSIHFYGLYIDLLLNDDFGTSIRLEMPFTWRQAGRVQLLDPESPPTLAPVHSLTGKRITKAQATKEGFLFLAFEDGVEIQAPADADGHIYEAWEIGDRHGYLVICAVGGEVFIWVPSEEDSRIKRQIFPKEQDT